MLDRHAWALLRRLTRWLDQFKDCFGHRAQHASLRQYVDGLLGDSARKSMSAMLARVSEPTSYQAFQHFITHAPWDAEVVWRRLRARLPERTGILILDETSFPKSGPHSVGAARQYLRRARQGGELPSRGHRRALGETARVAGGGVALSARDVDERCGATGGGPDSRARRVSGEVAPRPDAGAPGASGRPDPDGGGRRRRIRRQPDGPSDAASAAPALRLGDFADADGLPWHAHAARRSRATAAAQSPRRLARSGPGQCPRLSDALPPRAWHRVAWRNGTHPPWAADFAARRVTPATDWRKRRLAPEIWLLCERGLGPTGRRKHYFVSLPATATLAQLVRLAHQRWAIEQHYQDFKSELGLDHFEGRTYPGWQHHMVISAVAYAFLQSERRRSRAGPRLTFPQVCAFVQEIFTGLFLISRPRYLHWMNQAEQRSLQLRI